MKVLGARIVEIDGEQFLFLWISKPPPVTREAKG